MINHIIFFLTIFIISVGNNGVLAQDISAAWQREWPKTDFTKVAVPLAEIISGGPPKDGIPAIDNPIFKPLEDITDISEQEPIISLAINGDVRGYPLRILMFHEIVNDTVGGVPISVTYCPLCNSSLVFKRVVNGKILDFGTTGKLRYSDMIMYDRQTESWWQQFTGEGIVGYYTGEKLEQLPARIESIALFKKRYKQGKILVPNNPQAKPYGSNPYVNYDSAKQPFLFRGSFEGPISPLARVVVVGKDAWPLTLLREKKVIYYKGLRLIWEKGQASPLDNPKTAKGKEIGNVSVIRIDQSGKAHDVIYDLPFAFAFKAFNPDGILHIE